MFISLLLCCYYLYIGWLCLVFSLAQWAKLSAFASYYIINLTLTISVWPCQKHLISINQTVAQHISWGCNWWMWSVKMPSNYYILHEAGENAFCHITCGCSWQGESPKFWLTAEIMHSGKLTGQEHKLSKMKQNLASGIIKGSCFSKQYDYIHQDWAIAHLQKNKKQNIKKTNKKTKAQPWALKPPLLWNQLPIQVQEADPLLILIIYLNLPLWESL